jgi:hypothetical protein
MKNKSTEVMIHELKIQNEYLISILVGRKTFEVRLNDRDYKLWDFIKFLPLPPKEGEVDVHDIFDSIPNFKIIYLHQEFGMKKNYVVLGIENV